MIRHFTASAIILEHGRVLLLDHRKLGMWLPPGGHIEPNEDPAQAVRREVREEVGLEIVIVSERRFAHPAVEVVEPPFTILVEDVPDPEHGLHQHIDLIYVCTPSAPSAADSIEYDGYRWVPLGSLSELHIPAELPDLVAAGAAYAAGLQLSQPSTS